jgi:hypothetical protein
VLFKCVTLLVVFLSLVVKGVLQIVLNIAEKLLAGR